MAKVKTKVEKELLAEKAITLSDEQEAAITLCADLSVRIAGVTGGAGTGKTTTLKRAYAEMNAIDSTVLCAPTGRAAKRIKELTGIEAVTIHKLLEFPQPGEDGDPTEPKRDSRNRLDQRFVIVDESSMVGPTLYAQLMAALRNNACIRFFGDNNQLRPVEQGTPPFVEILETKPSVVLSFNYRSDDEIVGNANRILQGRIPTRNSRFEIVYATNPIKRLYEMADDRFMRFDHQIIMPTRKGNFGTQRVNTTLQIQLNGEGEYLLLDRWEKEAPPLSVRANDKFLWIKNDYNRSMFNGEIGRIADVDAHGGSLILDVEGRAPVSVPPRDKMFNSYLGIHTLYDPRKSLDLGYAVTTHKSQGSEFDTVVYVICSSHGWMLNRNNFYTAVTRARNNVIVITDTKSMGRSMNRAKL